MSARQDRHAAGETESWGRSIVVVGDPTGPGKPALRRENLNSQTSKHAPKRFDINLIWPRPFGCGCAALNYYVEKSIIFAKIFRLRVP